MVISLAASLVAAIEGFFLIIFCINYQPHTMKFIITWMLLHIADP